MLFFKLQFGFVKFWRMIIGAKAARKMLGEIDYNGRFY